ncbi:MAG: aspartyl protease family protein [Chloroflexi bacterium]|nr:aspartyl protease family protein [Chloroflexota bacterium]
MSQERDTRPYPMRRGRVTISGRTDGTGDFMGAFSVEIGIESRDRDEWVTLDALVDTGAFVTSAPTSLLRELGVEPMRTQDFTFPDGRTREMEIGQAQVRVGDREVTTLVLFNDEGSMALLGTLTLEGVFMGVDPVHKRLVPIRAVMA